MKTLALAFQKDVQSDSKIEIVKIRNFVIQQTMQKSKELQKVSLILSLVKSASAVGWLVYFVTNIRYAARLSVYTVT